MKTPEPPLVLS